MCCYSCLLGFCFAFCFLGLLLLLLLFVGAKQVPSCFIRRRPAVRDLIRSWRCRFDGRQVDQISLCCMRLVSQWLSSICLKKTVNISIPLKEKSSSFVLFLTSFLSSYIKDHTFSAPWLLEVIKPQVKSRWSVFLSPHFQLILMAYLQNLPLHHWLMSPILETHISGNLRCICSWIFVYLTEWFWDSDMLFSCLIFSGYHNKGPHSGELSWHLFPIVLGGWESEIQAGRRLVTPEASRGSIDSVLSLCPHTGNPLCVLCPHLFLQGHQAFWLLAHSSDLILLYLYLWKPYLLIHYYSEVPWTSTYKFGNRGTQLIP